MPDSSPSQERVAGIEPRYLGLGELFLRIRDAVIVGDASTGRVVLWNDAATSMFGYTPQEAVDLLIEDLVPESLKGSHRSGLRRFAEVGHGTLVDSGNVVELPAVRKDGSQIFIELSLTPLQSDRLPGRYAMAIVRDVTERRGTLARLAELQEIRNTFLATVAHDVRSPMAAVGGFAEILRSSWGGLAEADRERVLDGIARSAATVSNLLDDVLMVAALDSGEVPYAMKIVDLNAALTEAAEEQRAARPHVVFEVETNDPTASVWADPRRLWQVLTNLLSNAAAFTPEGERVVISARRNQGEMIVRIRDFGPGIREEDQPKLFQQFSQVVREGISTRHGTGLGLYICRVIIEAHGGSIWVESSLGAGASFVFTLPAAPPQE